LVIVVDWSLTFSSLRDTLADISAKITSTPLSHSSVPVLTSTDTLLPAPALLSWSTRPTPKRETVSGHGIRRHVGCKTGGPSSHWSCLSSRPNLWQTDWGDCHTHKARQERLWAKEKDTHHETCYGDTTMTVPCGHLCWGSFLLRTSAVVVRLFIGTQNRLVTFHSALIKFTKRRTSVHTV
jgi:hypothetical protein